MKIHKIILTIATLTLFTSVLPKVYFDDKGEKLFNGKDFPVLDICIFLDKYKAKANDEWTYYSKNQRGWDPIIKNLKISMQEEEASISCSNFMRELIDGVQGENEYKKIIDNLNNQEKWLKLITKDKEFVILIPKKKYPDIKNIEDIEKIGLNKEILEELNQIPYSKDSKDSKFYEESELAQQNRINAISKETPQLKTVGLIKHETLLNIFLDTPQAKKIMKRVYLAGHGYFQETQIQSKISGPIEIKKPLTPIETGAAIAQLRPYQYVKLLERLSEIACSFLYVCSCYSGGYNALTCQNAGFYEEKNIFKKFESITEKIPFIIVVESTPDTYSGNASAFKTNNFFIKINDFFIKQRESLESYSMTKNIFISSDTSNIREIDIIIGELVKGKEGEKISLIEQKPWLIRSKGLAEILNNARIFMISNLSSVRFPGAPFFRAALEYQDPESEKEFKLLKENPIYKKRSELQQNRDNEKEGSEAYNNFQRELDEIYKNEEYKKIAKEIDELSPLLSPIVIDYKFLLSREIKSPGENVSATEALKKSKATRTQKEEGTIIKIEYPRTRALIYPSIINIPIIIGENVNNLLSMIPGRAQHYFKSITLEKPNEKIIENFALMFTSQSDPTKLYFIEKFKGVGNKNKVTNLVIKIEQGKSDYIYKGEDKKYYKKGSNKENDSIIEEEVAIKTIKDWILQTTPAKEAIHEATAGIENIYKFRIKINQIFGGEMFNAEELGKKQKK